MYELHLGAGAAGPEGHPEGVEDKVGAHVAGELPADDVAAVRVDHEREEHQPVPAAQVGQIANPQPVGAGDVEVSLHEVRAPTRRGIRRRRAPWLAAPLRALQAVSAHHALHRAPRGWVAGTVEGFPHPPVPVGVVVRLMQLPDPLE